MGMYFENYSLKEKLFEYGELSARKQALEIDLSNCIDKGTKKYFNKLKSGEINSVIELGKIIDEILNNRNEIELREKR